MVYWYAEFPDQPEVLAYHSRQYQADARYLEDLVTEILSLPETGFPLTTNLDRCRFCVYRSLCGRGVEAGSLEELDAAQDLDAPGVLTLDFDQIGEIAF